MQGWHLVGDGLPCVDVLVVGARVARVGAHACGCKFCFFPIIVSQTFQIFPNIYPFILFATGNQPHNKPRHSTMMIMQKFAQPYATTLLQTSTCIQRMQRRPTHVIVRCRAAAGPDMGGPSNNPPAKPQRKSVLSLIASSIEANVCGVVYFRQLCKSADR